MTSAADIEELILAVRQSFHSLKARGDALHAHLGVTAAMRGVMESLAREGQQTVPQIAQGKGVSRQHIQTLADVLAAKGLVAASGNPAHKRSPLIGLTLQGRKVFAQMHAREAGALRDIAGDFDTAAVKTTTHVLQRLDGILRQQMETPLSSEEAQS